MIKELKLTPKESDIWDWAVDPAREYWEELALDDGKHLPESPVHFVVDGIARWDDTDPEVLLDLIYRIGTQLRESAMEQGAYYADGRPDEDMIEARSILPAISSTVRKMRKFTSRQTP
jgi:hypothetical protein